MEDYSPHPEKLGSAGSVSSDSSDCHHFTHQQVLDHCLATRFEVQVRT